MEDNGNIINTDRFYWKIGEKGFLSGDFGKLLYNLVVFVINGWLSYILFFKINFVFKWEVLWIDMIVFVLLEEL